MTFYIDTTDFTGGRLITSTTNTSRVNFTGFGRTDTAVPITIQPLTITGVNTTSADFASTDSFEVCIGYGDQAPTAGTFTLTIGAYTTAALNYNVSAGDLQTALSVIMVSAGKQACTVTKLADGLYRAQGVADGAITTGSLTGDKDALYPTSTVTIFEDHLGSSSSPYVLLIGLRQSQLAYATPSTTSGNAKTGTINVNTVEMFAYSEQQTGDTFEVPFYIRRTRTSGEVRTIFGPVPITIDKAGLNPLTAVPTSAGTFVVGDLFYASSTTAVSRLAIGTSGYVLTSNGTIPGWAAASGGGGFATTTLTQDATIDGNGYQITFQDSSGTPLQISFPTGIVVSGGLGAGGADFFTDVSVQSAHNLTVSTGYIAAPSVKLTSSTYKGTLSPATLSADRTYQFPDANLTITGGGTLSLGGFTFTVPSTGTAVTTATLSNATLPVSCTTLTASGTSTLAAINATGSCAVTGTITSVAAATQDAIRLSGRAGGTGSFFASFTPTTLAGSRTYTTPDATGTMALTSDITGGTLAGSFTTLAASGALTGTTASFTKTSAAENGISMTNANNGSVSAAGAFFQVTSNTASGSLEAFSTTYSFGDLGGKVGVSASNCPLAIIAATANPIQFYLGGISAGSKKLTLHSSGGMSLGSATDPGAGAFTASGTLAVTGQSTEGGSAAAAVTTQTRLVKAVSSIADNTATAVLTATIPNAAHSGMLRVRLIGSLGAGGAIGANEATGTIAYDFSITRTAGVNAVTTISSAYGSATSSVAGAATITVSGAASAISGAVGSSNTFTVNVTIAKGSGSSANHTCLVSAEIVNANATGMSIA